MGQPVAPPNYRKADKPSERCDNCRMGFHRGKDTALCCWGYGNVRVAPDYVCDSWAKEPKLHKEK